MVEEVPVAAGKGSIISRVLGGAGKVSKSQQVDPWTAQDRETIAAAVDSAEKHCGIQMMVFVGRSADNPRQQAIDMLTARNFKSVPGVFFLVDPDKKQVEVVTSETAKDRVSDTDCDKVIEAMVPSFRGKEFANGLAKGIALTAEIAGPGEESGEELPDMLN